MANLLKLLVFHVSKLMGLFWMSRRLTSQGLRILCYHGFATIDETTQFLPQLFIQRDTFRRRMRHLRDAGYPVFSLQEALSRRVSGELPSCSVVITIDDGMHSVYEPGFSIIEEFGFPVTVYVTSYYLGKITPIFRLLVRYIFWKTQRRVLDVSKIPPLFLDNLDISSQARRTETAWRIIEHCEAQCSESERWEVSNLLAFAAGVELNEVLSSRTLHIMGKEELVSLVHRGADVQLHTHRHRLPEDSETIKREIEENRNVLEPLVGIRLRHLCYPSGVWSKAVWPTLESLSVESATTCDPGLNYPKTPILGLTRFLDGEYISQIEFEAEVAGFSELLRRCRGAVKRAMPRVSARH